jgi:hypothetical protein
MGDLSHLTTTVGRFTTSAQLAKFEAFLEREKTNLGTLHATLSTAVATVRANLEWDEKYMSAFVKRLHEINSASVRIVSAVLTFVTLISLYLVN